MRNGNAKIGMDKKVGNVGRTGRFCRLRRGWLGPTVNPVYTWVPLVFRRKMPPKTDLLFSLSSFFSSRGDGVGASLSEDVSLRTSTAETGRCCCGCCCCCWYCCCCCCAYCWYCWCWWCWRLADEPIGPAERPSTWLGREERLLGPDPAGDN